MPRVVNPSEFVDTPTPPVSRGRPVDPSELEEDDDSSISPWAVGAGALGVGALALLGSRGNPAVLKNVMDARRLSMLSGFGLLKSLLGAGGGAAYSSIERQSMAPLKEMFSGQTVKDAVSAFKRGAQFEGEAPSAVSKFNIFGRAMGAGDEAAQAAFQRAGLTAKESAKEMLQTELGDNALTRSLKGPVADYLVPFRRTPFNQLSEGMASFQGANLATKGQKIAQATALGTGAVTGATVDDPKAIGLGTALSGRRGLPFAVGAAAGRTLATGNKREGAKPLQGMSPVSDYSLAEGVTKPFTDPLGSIVPVPAAVSAYATLKKWLGLE